MSKEEFRERTIENMNWVKIGRELQQLLVEGRDEEAKELAENIEEEKRKGVELKKRLLKDMDL